MDNNQFWKSVTNIQEIFKGDIIRSVVITKTHNWYCNTNSKKIGIVVSGNHKTIYDIHMIDLNTNKYCQAVSNPGNNGSAYIDKFSYNLTNPRKKRKILGNPDYLIY